MKGAATIQPSTPNSARPLLLLVCSSSLPQWPPRSAFSTGPPSHCATSLAPRPTLRSSICGPFQEGLAVWPVSSMDPRSGP
jgi:hypothetical protein